MINTWDVVTINAFVCEGLLTQISHHLQLLIFQHSCVIDPFLFEDVVSNLTTLKVVTDAL